MTQGPPPPVDRYLPPGTRVTYDGLVGEAGAVECGTVVDCWRDEMLQAWDCRVAFYGPGWPADPDGAETYTLRYLATSLEVVDGDTRGRERGGPGDAAGPRPAPRHRTTKGGDTR